MGSELLYKFHPTVAPCRGELQVVLQYTLFKPLQCHLLQVADGKEDLGCVCQVLVQVRVEGDLALEDERSEVFWVRTIEGVWHMDV